jgi:hypothetical protein
MSQINKFRQFVRSNLLWIFLVICFIFFLLLIFYELTWVPTYIPFRDLTTFPGEEWSIPSQGTITTTPSRPLSNRYYVWRSELSDTDIESYEFIEIIHDLNEWLVDNGWNQDYDPTYSCDILYFKGVLLGDQETEWKTYKPKGWVQEDKWSVVICIGIQYGERLIPDNVSLSTVTLSFWTDIYSRMEE